MEEPVQKGVLLDLMEANKESLEMWALRGTLTTARSSVKEAGDLHGWTRNSSENSHVSRRYMRCRGQDAWDEYREVIRVYRNETRKAEAHLELNMAKDVKDKNFSG